MVRQGSGEDAVAPGCESSDAVGKKKKKKSVLPVSSAWSRKQPPLTHQNLSKKGAADTRRGHGGQDGRPSRCRADVFFISRRGEGGGAGRGRLLMRSTAPANWPAKARQSRLMSLPTQINASATTLRVSHLIWRRAGEELSDPLVHFMMYVNEQGGCN